MCQVIDLLIKERLIVSYSQEYKKGDNEGHENYVEPAHDALILYWDKLHKKDDAIQEEQSQNQEEEQGWLEEYKGNLDLRDRLINDVQKWQELKPEESEESDNKERKPKFSVKLKNYKKIGNFIDNFIELEMRFKLLKKLKSLFVKVIIFFLRLSLLLLGLFMIFVGIFLIISVLAYLVEEFWFLSNGYFSLFITIFFGLFGVLIGLFIALFGLLLISRNLAFRALKFLVIYIFWNSVVRCYRLLRKASNIISW
jgi:hypothetical protein